MTSDGMMNARNVMVEEAVMAVVYIVPGISSDGVIIQP
jgi:hypothetical protein